MSEFPTPDHWYQHRVSYGETDTMGVLYYAQYLHIFERSRSEFIRAYGLSYRTVEERGLFLPVREAGCRYRSPARYDDLIQVHVGVKEWRRASLTFLYEIYDESRTLLMATGFSEHACTDKRAKPIATPDWFKRMFTA